MLMLDDTLMDIIPKDALRVPEPEDILSPPETIPLPNSAQLEDYDANKAGSYQPSTFPQHVAKNILDASKFRNVIKNHFSQEYFNS